MPHDKAAAEYRSEPSLGFWRETWRRFKKRKLAVTALVYVLVLMLIALLAPLIAGTKPIVVKYASVEEQRAAAKENREPVRRLYFPFLGYYKMSWENPIFAKDRFRGRYAGTLQKKDPKSWAIWPLVYQDPYRRVRDNEWPEQKGSPVKSPPTKINWFGTNRQGFDVFASMVHGAQTAVSVGFVSMGIAGAIGITIGALSGYFGGWVDMLLSRLTEVVMCIPSLVLILAMVALLDNVNNFHLMAIVGVTGWTGIARLTRGEFLKLKQMEFVAAARALGAGSVRVMFRHVLRNALAPVLVPITFGIASAILIESGLSFLGFGASPPNPSWGTLLADGRPTIRDTWWLIVFPGLAIFITVLAYNLIGEALQEATDPRLRQDAH